MRRMYRQARRKQISLPAITLTPLIDTVLVLLVIFMVTTPRVISHITTEDAVSIPAPADEHDADRYKVVVVTVTDHGDFLVDDVPCAEDALGQLIEKGLCSSPIRTVRVCASPKAPVARLYQVIEAAKQREGVKIVFW